jgi:hypothetical protein
MKKYAANYLVADSGDYLKNGIIVAGEDGFVLKYIDTKGELREIAQLTFLNGILMAGCTFVKTKAANSEPDMPFESMVLNLAAKSIQFSIQDMIGLGKQIQIQFPEMNIPEIINGMKEVLLSSGGFTKENIAGIFLLTGVDLVNLHFTPKSRLKKIL